MTRMNRGVTTMLALALTAFGTTALQAQSTYRDTEREAQKLSQQAKDAAQDRSTFQEASRLYRQAAHVRGYCPESVEDLIMAGTLAFYVGHEGQAITDLVAAAEQALSWDDVVTAAESFLDAAWIAEKAGHAALVDELARRAEHLSNSPLIESGERIALQSRIEKERN